MSLKTRNQRFAAKPFPQSFVFVREFSDEA